MMDMNKLPEILSAAYQVIPLLPTTNTGQTDYVLAGGALRDAVLGRPVKDLDIFCHSSLRGRILAALDLLGIPYKYSPMYDGSTKKFSVIKTRFLGVSYDIDIVLIDQPFTPWTLITDMFDCDICRIACGYKQRAVDNLYVDPRFHTDITNKTVTYRTPPINFLENEEHNIRHAQRIVDKLNNKRSSLDPEEALALEGIRLLKRNRKTNNEWKLVIGEPNEASISQ